MRTTKLVLFVTMLAVGFTACRKKDAVDPDVLVNFPTNVQGITAAENSITIKVVMTSAATSPIPVEINLTEQGVVYGTDYTTLPAAASGKITLTVPTGNNEASFTLSKVTGRLFDGDEKIVFDINSAGIPVIIGATKQLTLTFGQLVASSIPNTEIQGGGPTYPNKVFFDLSANRQAGANRTSWDLGFYMGNEDYRVTLNSSVNMMVKQINKTDLNTVTAADTVGITYDLGFSQATPSNAQLEYIDYPDGDLTKTAIDPISATATDNKVYIVNRGNGIGTPAPVRGWKKIRIIRNGSGGYTLQHADIAATTFTSVEIAKDAAYNFKYSSFETGALTVEPEKNRWDFAWSYGVNVTNFGGGEVPYMFQDMITLNRGVSVAKVLTSSVTYEAFTMANVAGQTFLTAQNAIAADWRRTSPTPAQVYSDRFYVVKDAEGNYYKLKFTSLTGGTGGNNRGFPAFQADKL